MAKHGETLQNMARHGKNMATHGKNMANHGKNMANHGKPISSESRSPLSNSNNASPNLQSKAWVDWTDLGGPRWPCLPIGAKAWGLIMVYHIFCHGKDGQKQVRSELQFRQASDILPQFYLWRDWSFSGLPLVLAVLSQPHHRHLQVSTDMAKPYKNCA